MFTIKNNVLIEVQYTNGVSIISIPEGVEKICKNAFNDYGFCSSITEINIPSTVKEIEDGAFSYEFRDMHRFLVCKQFTHLQAINVSPDNSFYASYKGLIYSKDYSKIVFIPRGITEFCLHPSLEYLPERIFYDFTKMVSITLPDSLHIIGKEAFQNCKFLRSIVIPEQVTVIQEKAFLNCSSLTNVEFKGDHVSKNVIIEKAAFMLCVVLDTVVIPDSTIKIGDFAFALCKSLRDFRFPQSLYEVGKKAFYGCAKLCAVTLPQTPVSITEDAFDGCSSLKEITYIECNTSEKSNIKPKLIDEIEVQLSAGVYEDLSVPLELTIGELIEELIRLESIPPDSYGARYQFYDEYTDILYKDRLLTIEEANWYDGMHLGLTRDYVLYGCPTAKELPGLVPECMLSDFKGFIVGEV